jgi:predicted DNA-binding transcriptional regulator YafY
MLLLPEVPAPSVFTHSENRMIAETLAQIVPILPSAGPGTTLNAEDRAVIREAIDPTLQEHYDFLLTHAERFPYIYPFEWADNLTKLMRELNEHNERVWQEQCALLIADAQSNSDREAMNQLFKSLDQRRRVLLEYADPDRSMVYKNPRD